METKESQPNIITVRFAQHELEQAIEESIPLLDTFYGISWTNRIDLEHLNMDSWFDSLGGQLEGSYLLFMSRFVQYYKIRTIAFEITGSALGLTREDLNTVLTHLWTRKILELQEARKLTEASLLQ